MCHVQHCIWYIARIVQDMLVLVVIFRSFTSLVPLHMWLLLIHLNDLFCICGLLRVFVITHTH